MNSWSAKLEAELHRYDRLAIAFSGGCDSTLLAEAARRVLGSENVLALLAESVMLPRAEYERALNFARSTALRLEIVKLDPLAETAVRANGPLRCYHCKRRIFTALLARARERGFETLADGANFDDRGDYRPGARAADELGIVHPLRDFPKAAIRELAKAWNLPVWNLPAAACLASRIPTGTPLDRESLARIEAAEAALTGLGYSGHRVRKTGPSSARLEFRPDDLDRARNEAKLLAARLKKSGFDTVEIASYHTGFRLP